MDISFFFDRQLRYAESFRTTFNALKNSLLREINFEGFKYVLQLNPLRIKSSTADISKPLDREKCFLCKANMPPYQLGMDFDENFTIFVNPFPIFSRHFTIVSRRHTPQTIAGNVMTMLEAARELEGLVVFYNSPKSGASAPFHCHFQAGGFDEMPLFYDLENLVKLYKVSENDGVVKVDDTTRRFLIVKEQDVSEAEKKIKRILDTLNSLYGMTEPEANIGAVYRGGFFCVVILPREKHRPFEYSLPEDERILVSPGFADLAGMVPCSLKSDFEKITKENIKSIMSQVTITEEKFIKI